MKADFAHAALASQLIELARRWNIYYLSKLHSKAKERLEGLTEQIRQKSKGLHRPVSDIDALRHVMDTLTSITQQESGRLARTRRLANFWLEPVLHRSLTGIAVLAFCLLVHMRGQILKRNLSQYLRCTA